MKKNRLQSRLDGFKALVESDRSASYLLEETDGSRREWGELSAEAKLRQVADAAAYYDVPFEPFAAAVGEVLRELPPAHRAEAALRLALRCTRELHALEKLFPDDGRTESPPPLVERVRELMGKTSLADLKAEALRDRQGQRPARDSEKER